MKNQKRGVFVVASTLLLLQACESSGVSDPEIVDEAEFSAVFDGVSMLPDSFVLDNLPLDGDDEPVTVDNVQLTTLD